MPQHGAVVAFDTGVVTVEDHPEAVAVREEGRESR
jgi:hypothetical protein